MDFQVDAASVIRKYQEQLTQVTHGSILLQAQVEALQAKLAQLEQTNGSATSTAQPPTMDVLRTESQPSLD